MLFKNSCKLRQLNQIRPAISLEWDLHCLLISFFNPNLSSKSESSRQNRFQRLRNPCSNLIERDQKYIESDQIWSTFQFKSTLLKKINIFIFFIFQSNFVKFNQSEIKIRSKLWLMIPFSSSDLNKTEIDVPIWMAYIQMVDNLISKPLWPKLK